MTIKKFTSIILSIVFVFSLFVLPVSAEEVYDDAVELALGEKITINFTDEVWDKYIKFVADKTMTVSVSSETADGSDPYCMVFDADGTDIASADDSYAGYDFICKFEVTEGETYYILVTVYDIGPATTVVSLACGHNYTDGICGDCGEECAHDVLNDFGECECGQYFDGGDLVTGENSFAFELNEAKYYRFIPEEDGIYMLRSASAESDPYCYLYDADCEYLNSADDIDEDLNFELFYVFEAGERYFFELGDYYDVAEWTATLEKLTHGDDNGEHVYYFEEEYYGTCQEVSYSAGIYCEDCGKYIYGHEVLGYGFHEDADNDAKCDFCGIVLYEEPSAPDILGGFIVMVIQFFKNFFLTLFTMLGIW